MTEMNDKYEQMNNFRLANDSLPDGAFFALAAEHGFDVDDWVWFNEEFEKRGRRSGE